MNSGNRCNIYGGGLQHITTVKLNRENASAHLMRCGCESVQKNMVGVNESPRKQHIVWGRTLIIEMVYVIRFELFFASNNKMGIKKLSPFTYTQSIFIWWTFAISVMTFSLIYFRFPRIVTFQLIRQNKWRRIRILRWLKNVEKLLFVAVPLARLFDTPQYVWIHAFQFSPTEVDFR